MHGEAHRRAAGPMRLPGPCGVPRTGTLHAGAANGLAARRPLAPRVSHPDAPVAPSIAELVIRSTGAGLFITAAGHAISARRSVYHGADYFILVRSVDVSPCPLSISFRSAPIETPRKSSVIQRNAQPAVKRPAVANHYSMNRIGCPNSPEKLKEGSHANRLSDEVKEIRPLETRSPTSLGVLCGAGAANQGQ